MSFRGQGGLALAADRRGPEDGPAVLMLHGGGQTRGSWNMAANALAARGLSVTTLDLRGHGESAWSADGDYQLHMFAEDLREVVDQLGTAPVLVGASLGGIASMLACGESPHARAAALVLVDIVPRMESSGGNAVVGFMRRTASGFDTLDHAADAIAEYLPHRPRPRSNEGLAKNLRQGDDGRYYWRWDPAFVTPREGWDPDASARRIEAAALAITVPILMVRGMKSDVVSQEAAESFRQLLPHAEIAEVADAHHMVAGDDNDAFLDAITAFVTRHARQGENANG